MTWNSAFSHHKPARGESRPQRHEYNVLRKRRGNRQKDMHRPSRDTLLNDDGDDGSLDSWKQKTQVQKVSRWKRMFGRRAGS
ncbi:hypothetical protein FOPE_02436 [Fonsecaea pedrosoi]|nr:hypothetical protein FOPE_02436 [Fonsecaea pedrosoi]